MKHANSKILILLSSSLILFSCGGGAGSSGTSLPLSSSGISSSASELTAAEKKAGFDSLQKAMTAYCASDNAGFLFSTDGLVGANDSAFEASLLTNIPVASGDSSSSSSSSSQEVKPETAYTIKGNYTSARVVNNGRSAPSLKDVSTALALTKLRLALTSGTGDEESTASYTATLSTYITGGTAYIDTSKSSLLRTAVNGLVQKTEGNETWELPALGKKAIPDSSYSAISTLAPLTVTTKKRVQSIRDKIEAEAAKLETGFALTADSGRTNYVLTYATTDFERIYETLVSSLDELTGIDTTAIKQGLYDFKSSLKDFSLSLSVPFTSSAFGSIVYSFSYSSDEAKLKAAFSDQSTLLISAKATGKILPLTGESATAEIPSDETLATYAEIPDIVLPDYSSSLEEWLKDHLGI